MTLAGWISIGFISVYILDAFPRVALCRSCHVKRTVNNGETFLALISLEFLPPDPLSCLTLCLDMAQWGKKRKTHSSWTARTMLLDYMLNVWDKDIFAWTYIHCYMFVVAPELLHREPSKSSNWQIVWRGGANVAVHRCINDHQLLQSTGMKHRFTNHH